MKNRFFTLIAVFALPALVMVACGKKDGGGGSTATAVTPLTTTCFNGTACNPAVYNQYQQYGFMAYPGYSYAYPNYGYGYSNNNPGCFNGCGAGYYPVYNNTIGMGCVSAAVIQPVMTWVGYYYLAPANMQWTNIPQNSNIPNSGTATCQQGVAQSCFLNNGNNACGEGYNCRPSMQGSAIGLCVRN